VADSQVAADLPAGGSEAGGSEAKGSETGGSEADYHCQPSCLLFLLAIKLLIGTTDCFHQDFCVLLGTAVCVD
jgi:hypothetical protein